MQEFKREIYLTRERLRVGTEGRDLSSDQPLFRVAKVLLKDSDIKVPDGFILLPLASLKLLVRLPLSAGGSSFQWLL